MKEINEVTINRAEHPINYEQVAIGIIILSQLFTKNYSEVENNKKKWGHYHQIPLINHNYSHYNLPSGKLT